MKDLDKAHTCVFSKLKQRYFVKGYIENSTSEQLNVEAVAVRWWITRWRVQCEDREGGILKTRQKQRLENKDATDSVCVYRDVVREGGLVD